MVDISSKSLGTSALRLNGFLLALRCESCSIRLQVLIDDRASTEFVFRRIDRIDLQLADLATVGRT